MTQRIKINASDAGKLIETLREDRDWTRVDLEKLSGVASHIIRNWEQGGNPRLDQYEQVLNAFGYELVARKIRRGTE